MVSGRIIEKTRIDICRWVAAVIVSIIHFSPTGLTKDNDDSIV